MTNLEAWRKLNGLDLRYGPVIYNQNKQKEIDRTLAIWNEIDGNVKKFDFLIIDALMYRIKIWSIFKKNSLFEEEKEVRVAFFRLNYEFIAEKLVNNSYQVEYEYGTKETQSKATDFLQ
jgi:hypothetical protein